MTDHEGPVGEALQAPARLHHGPEIVAGVSVKGASFAGLQPHLPNPDPVVLEPYRGAEIVVARCSYQLARELLAVKDSLFDDVRVTFHFNSPGSPASRR